MQIWNEEGQVVDTSALREGCLVQLTFDNVDLGIKFGNPLWVYSGLDTDDPNCLVFNVPGEVMANTAGRICHLSREKVWARSIQLLEIVAKEPHAVWTIFHSWGVRKAECVRLKRAISNATGYLTGF